MNIKPSNRWMAEHAGSHEGRGWPASMAQGADTYWDPQSSKGGDTGGGTGGDLKQTARGGMGSGGRHSD